MPEERPDEPENLDTPPPFFPMDEGELSGHVSADHGEPIKVSVEGVYVAQSGSEVQRFVLLTDGSRRLPIVIGEAETYAITLPLERKKHGRPMTHDLMVSVMEKLDVQLNRVVVDDLWGSVYYAKMFLRQDGMEYEIDSRPSDAIALAVRVDAPIFVADGILEQAGQ